MDFPTSDEVTAWTDPATIAEFTETAHHRICPTPSPIRLIIDDAGDDQSNPRDLSPPRTNQKAS